MNLHQTLVEDFRAVRATHSLTAGAALAVAAAILGLYFRLKGLGTWPLTNDEFYIVFAVESILENGLPSFECGGYYMRGLLMQVLMLPLAVAGVPAEFYVRILSVLSYLLALPPLYFLTRTHSRVPVALSVCAIFALSLWEIELSRFGRMYMPFQALFLWYLLVALRSMKSPTWAPRLSMLGLTVAGVLLWEGAVFLACANFLPLLRRPKLDKIDWLHGLLSAVVLVGVYSFLTFDFRHYPMGVDAFWPPDLLSAAGGFSPDNSFGGLLTPVIILGQSLPFWLVAICALLTAGGSIPIWRTLARRDWRAGAFGLLMVIAALFNQLGILVIAAIVAFGLGIDYSNSKLEWRRLSYVCAALLAVNLLLAFLAPDWSRAVAERAVGTGTASLLAYLDALGGFRMQAGYFVVATVSYPFGLITFLYSMLTVYPLLAVVWPIAIACGVFWALRNPSREALNYRLLVLMLVTLLVLSSVLNIGAQSRYWFHLYPLILSIALAGPIALFAPSASRLSVGGRAVGWLLLAAGVGVWAFSRDLDLEHIASIDSAESNFRTRYAQDRRLVSHLIMRRDYRAAADELDSLVDSEDRVVSTLQTLAYYYPNIDQVYFGSEHGQFSNYTACSGTRVRWADAGLIYNIADLERSIDGESAKLWLVANAARPRIDERPLLAAFGQHEVWRSFDGEISIFRFDDLDDAPSRLQQ